MPPDKKKSQSARVQIHGAHGQPPSMRVTQSTRVKVFSDQAENYSNIPSSPSPDSIGTSTTPTEEQSLDAGQLLLKKKLQEKGARKSRFSRKTKLLSLETSQSEGESEVIRNGEKGKGKTKKAAPKGGKENDGNWEDAGWSTKQPTNPAKAKEYLLKHPEFLDGYVKSSVELQTVRHWLNNKGICGYHANATADCTGREDFHKQCPNSSLLGHFKRGQDAYRNIPPHCCTCTEIPTGPKSRRPYVIYAIDPSDSGGNAQQTFTVPRVMTINEMDAFSRRYGFDLCRRMNMY